MKSSSIFTFLKPVIKTKSFIAFILIFVWVGIFDQNSLIERWQLNRRIDQLNAQKQHYLEEIEQNNRKMDELQSSTSNLEKFGREEYLMKKKNEVIFVVEEE